ncbi:MAG TPA: hypothetical protein DEQ34_03085 [Balneolaceae bacterium]|nr:hypothetical protein [Balneolaceae bacterium]|tara:strand:+ start:71771 stop:72037 length:267 start_codon:yes stop_codon:yes gene_type:complete
MRKLNPSEKQILDRLIFPEPYEVIQDETGFASGALRDDLINLINYRLIEVMNTDGDAHSSAFSYDSDNLQQFTFRATKTGLKKIREAK